MPVFLAVCGARPNFVKVAPVIEALRRTAGGGDVGRGVACGGDAFCGVRTLLVHTGQHYDDRMSRRFFAELGIPDPDLNLQVGSGPHGAQTAEVMKRFEPVCIEHRPDWVIVVGDVNSTLAAALVAAKLGIRVAHVEAGLRSFDRSMPEEINRVLTDAISDALFVTEPAGVLNLRREGIADSKVHLVGNVMADTLLRNRARADDSNILSSLELEKGGYAVVTLHRPSNVDDKATFSSILGALEQISADMPVVFPVHPRTRKNLDEMGLSARMEGIASLRVVPPLGYLDFLKLTAESALMLTDSGGIQEETTILQVPCLTLRENTERPITITQGTNRLTGSGAESILAGYHGARSGARRAGSVPDLWDGHAAERIVAHLLGAD